MKEKKETSPLYFLLGIALIIAYQYILPRIYFPILKPLIEKNNFWITNIINIGYYLFIVVGLIFLFRKSLKEEWNKFKKEKKFYTKTGLKAWIKGYGLMILSNFIVLSITNGVIAGNEAQNREILNQMPFYAITIICFIGPFIEELVFRKSFKKAFQNKYLFTIITSLIFASLHVINSFDPLTLESILNNWTQLFYLLPYSSLAIFLALSYYETDNIFTSTIAHCFHNTLTVIITLIAGSVGIV